MNFYEALELCLKGNRITREDWNGKGMYVYYTPGRQVPIRDWFVRNDGDYPTKDEITKGYIELAGHFDMMNAQRIRIIGWVASQTDMASDKWMVLD